MKIKVKEQIEREIEITFPTFKKSPAFVYKIIAEDKVLRVDTTNTDFSITLCSYINSNILEAETITEIQFINTYNEVLTRLNSNL